MQLTTWLDLIEIFFDWFSSSSLSAEFGKNCLSWLVIHVMEISTFKLEPANKDFNGLKRVRSRSTWRSQNSSWAKSCITFRALLWPELFLAWNLFFFRKRMRRDGEFNYRKNCRNVTARNKRRNKNSLPMLSLSRFRSIVAQCRHEHDWGFN